MLIGSRTVDRSSRFRRSGPPSAEKPMAAPPPDRLDISPSRGQQRQGLGTRKKIALGLLTGLSLVSSVGALGAVAARNLPVCESSSPLAWEQDRVCVSPDLSRQADGLERVLRGKFHTEDAISDLQSASNRIFYPEEPLERPPGDESLTVSSWNLHHGTGQDADGARNQLGEQIERLNQSESDIDLLQEVLPWHVEQIVNETGKVGYYSQTTERQGNLILVSPELEVHQNTRLTLNHDTANDGDEAERVVSLKSGEEPRAVQILSVTGEETRGEEVFVFNTHMSTMGASDSTRAAEAERLISSLDERSEGASIVGGGDLNTLDGEGVVKRLAEQGYDVEGARIDFFAARGPTLELRQADDLTSSDGTRLSDHPYLLADFQSGETG